MTDFDERKWYETVDLPFFREEVAPFLPETILDFHAHTWSSANWAMKPWESDRPGGKYMVGDSEYPPETLLADGARIFPDRTYTAVCFGYPVPVVDWEKDTAFVADAGTRPNLYPLVLAGKPLGLSRSQYEEAIDARGFLGYKVFLDWFGNNYGDVTVEDMLGPEEMELADERGLVVLLHVPRAGRLADPVVQRGVEKLAKDAPNARIVLAHCGRCYISPEMKAAVGMLRDLDNVFLDASMVMDPVVLQMVLETMDSSRLLYATDFPIAVMRGRRVRVLDHWVDVVLDNTEESAYRVQSDGIRATFMAVEICVAIREAAERVGLSDEALRAIFHDNGMAALEHVMGGKQIERVRAGWKR